jgi:hypothetical protein
MKKSKAQSSEKRVLAHIKHTGKRLPNRHTSFPVIAFILLVLGVFLLGITASSEADVSGTPNNVLVTAQVAGLPPAHAAVITSPPNGSKVNSYDVPISGTCIRSDVVELYRNNILAGTALCSAKDTFTIPIGLICGQNSLYTKIYNLGNTEGPNSPISTVSVVDTTKTITTVTTPTLNGSSSTSSYSVGSQGCALTEAPMLLQTNVSYQETTVGQTLKWIINVGGGTGPYAINVDWGDGTTSILSVATQGNFEISHDYSKPGGYHGNYPIKITAIDAINDQSFLQVFALVNSANSIPSGVNNPTNNGGAAGTLGDQFGPSTGALHAAWSIYAVGFLMALSFWLGERRGFEIDTRLFRKSKLKAHKS